ncbi:preprotein translocase subunit YajC [Enterococcus avium]|jgi:preprotein translocase subunit YajC|uniref:Preprotein translocase subunit YajC n=2 Tax=Enterococcus avium TaxID=33945 RepID=A0ABD5F9B7_ENTAV|nr:preprotein translocase subunit YajC [Enterococcus avium]MCB6528579.1 preprotein translocase subunit YajC [Enterococcus avium]MCG4866386.1 preprotein translocase subunit YajC [Enterococcus avium]MCQ4674427.1 preprotein translocase subunit YajC [Enterococcus avium]MDB1748748.1 preprotein translocase subunit YajC [Enterococcus avium]MDB1752750.1 preprotein translocase subunit YajC [Enterococcus avium]
MGNFSMIILLVLMLGMFFFMNRSQKKQQQERQNLLDAMKVGDSVVTIGGLHGVISEINNSDKTVTLDCEGIYLIFDRASIRTVKSGVRPAAAPVEPAAVEPEPTEPVVEETPEDKTEENTEEK